MVATDGETSRKRKVLAFYRMTHRYYAKGLLHIRDALREAREFVEGEDYESFVENRMVQNAVMRSFEVVGEATRHLSPEFREAHPQVPWRLMGDFRNKLIHDYFALDIEVVWKTATEDAPLLLSQIEGLMEEV